MSKDRLTEELIHQSVEKGAKLKEGIDETLKGKEMEMPEGISFIDKDGTKRTEIRIKWWEDPSLMNYRSISVEPIDNLPEQPIKFPGSDSIDFYNDNEKPVFFGHYWLKGQPSLYKNNICCLDYSIAKKGKLVAYPHDGEKILDPENFVYV